MTAVFCKTGVINSDLSLCKNKMDFNLQQNINPNENGIISSNNKRSKD